MKTQFGERIQIIRKNAGCSQKKFGSELNIPQTTLSAYETDRMQPTVAALISIATKYDVSMDWLCGLEPKEPQLNVTTLEKNLQVIFNIFYRIFALSEDMTEAREKVKI